MIEKYLNKEILLLNVGIINRIHCISKSQCHQNKVFNDYPKIN